MSVIIHHSQQLCLLKISGFPSFLFTNLFFPPLAWITHALPFLKILTFQQDLCSRHWCGCFCAADTGASSAITTSPKTRCRRTTSCPSAGPTTPGHTATTTTLAWRCPTTGCLAPIHLTDEQNGRTMGGIHQSDRPNWFLFSFSFIVRVQRTLET